MSKSHIQSWLKADRYRLSGLTPKSLDSASLLSESYIHDFFTLSQMSWCLYFEIQSK